MPINVSATEAKIRYFTETYDAHPNLWSPDPDAKSELKYYSCLKIALSYKPTQRKRAKTDLSATRRSGYYLQQWNFGATELWI